MKLIRPNVEIWEQGNTLEDVWKHIARCTRVCYQSTPKKDSETDEEFVKRVILRPDSSTGRLNFNKIHGSMLEHGTVYLYLEVGPNNAFRKYEYPSAHFTAPYNWSDVVGHIRAKYKHNKYSKVVTNWENEEKSIRGTYITTNLRVIYENDWLQDLKFCSCLKEHHIRRVTVSFITNIGVTREFNRHRVNSIAEESTRYCNYSLGKFNNNITCCSPAWIPSYIKELNAKDSQERLDTLIKEYGTENEHAWSDLDYYLLALETCNYCYNNLILKGWKPQQAREVLPLATKSQLIHTAFVDDWKHFFALRVDGISGLPHPNAALIAKPLKEEFIKRGYI